uniref:Uncharacterized protein n=1 Tax=Astatotilapia calliptera TaxID=8154 RepID=A0AAX7U5Y7_ASTCA
HEGKKDSLVFCRLPHGGVLRPSRYLFGCYVSSNSCCSSPVSNPHTQSVSQLASTSMQEDKCDILGVVHGAALHYSATPGTIRLITLLTLLSLLHPFSEV